MEPVWHSLISCKCKAMANQGILTAVRPQMQANQIITDEINEYAFVIVLQHLEMIIECGV